MSTPIAGDRIVNPLDPLVIEHILQTIRNRESHSNYQALNKTASASGAYQYIDSTWKTKAIAVPGASQYPRAYQAPKTIQDAVAAANVMGILAVTGNHLAGVPVYWYSPAAWGNDAKLNSIPAPEAGNTQTVRQYAEGWLKDYDKWTGFEGDPQVVGTGGGINFPGSGILKDIGGSAADVFEGLTSPLDVLKKIAELLTSAGTWIRVAQVVGGAAFVGMGLWIITHDSGSMVPKVPTIAAAAL